MKEIEQLKKIVQDQARMLVEKNRQLADMEYRLKQITVSGSRKEDLARFQSQLSKDTIEEQSSLLKALLESVPCGVMVFDAKKNIVTCNRRAQEILGVPEEDVLGKEYAPFLGETRAEVEKALAEGHGTQTTRTLFRAKNGRPLLLSLNVSLVQNSRGAILGGMILFSEGTEKRCDKAPPLTGKHPILPNLETDPDPKAVGNEQ
jgi:PAS domain S-box-containing protein